MLLDNKPSSTVLEGLKRIIAEEGALDVAVSYVQVSGWMALAPLIQRLAPSRVRLLVTDQFELTHPRALELIMTSGVGLRRYLGDKVYHPKVYVARDSGDMATAAIVGSANLSDSGLTRGVEAAALIRDDAMLRDVAAWFDCLWDAPKGTADVDAEFVRQYRPRWRAAARARVKLRRVRRRRIDQQATAAFGEDIEVLEDVCETIRIPLAILSADQAGNNIRNLSRLLEVLRAFPSVHAKARSELRLLGLLDDDALTSVGQQAKRCRSIEALARVWCKWVHRERESTLLAINPKLANFRRSANLFWKLRAEVRQFFFSHLCESDERPVLMAIELLCNTSDIVREFRIEDYRAVAPMLAMPTRLPNRLRRAIEEYHQNKGARSWTSQDRRILLEAWKAVQ